jgi:hypothetical protein
MEFPPTAVTGPDGTGPTPPGDQEEFLSRLDLAGLDKGQFLTGRLDPGRAGIGCGYGSAGYSAGPV